MSDDAIRKALEVAGQVILSERENMGALSHRVTAPGAKLEDRLAAAAIAAFLEALPDSDMLSPPIDPNDDDVGFQTHKGTLHNIAAAVRRAAGGG